MKTLLPYFILFATIFLKMASAAKCGVTESYEVHVVNKLPSPSLILHCASGNNDLGTWKTTTNYDFHWHFCDNYTGNTLFFCHLWWGKKVDRAFDVFTSKTSDRCRRGKCIWEARSDGIYLSGGQEPSEFKKMYDWNKMAQSD